MGGMQNASCAVGAGLDGHSCHPFPRFERRRSLLSFHLPIEEVLSREWSLGRQERGRQVGKSWLVQGEWIGGAAGRPWSPLKKDDGKGTRYK